MFDIQSTIQVEPGLSLQPISHVHCRELFNVIDESRISLRQWLGWVDRVKHERDFLRLIHYYQTKYELNGAGTYAIRYHRGLAGVISTNEINWRQRSATIGYWLGEPYRGQGLMVRACKALIQHLFEESELHRINILCSVGNHDSQKVPRSLNFTEEGCYRQAEWIYDRYEDLLVFGLLRSEYFAQPITVPARPELYKTSP